MNNLYGHGISQYLSYANFKWVKNITEIEQKLIRIKSNSSTGHILEVDSEYSKNLHYEHNDYPLAPEKIKIQKEWLSNYCLGLQMNIILVQEQPKISNKFNGQK